MIYQNPIIRGFYPDPSVCYANGKFYLVTSSFQYYPGVPLFESEDLINWKQIGHVLTRKSQVMLDKVRSSGGVFAPTIRFHDGRFYMVTNNNSTNKNFFVYTDDIYGEWSEPIEVDQDGIDPSLYFEDDRSYFITNGYDEETKDSGVIQCEIDIRTGKKLSESKCIWHGAGGRYLESPHMYKIGHYYYLMVAEGGTEYGHMICYGRSESIWGPFTNYPENPVITNRDKAPFCIQAIGHGDLIQNTDGNFYMVALGFRQIDEWMPFHHLGREVFLIPIHFDQTGWFSSPNGKAAVWEYEIPGNGTQIRKNLFTFENTDWNIDWCFLRDVHLENYELWGNSAKLTGTDLTLQDIDSPTFIGMRQIDFAFDLQVQVTLEVAKELMPDSKGHTPLPMAGITFYMCELEHYDLVLQQEDDTVYAALYLNIGHIQHLQKKIPLSTNQTTLYAKANRLHYDFFAGDFSKESFLGTGYTKYLSSEVSEGFTGTMIGLFATHFACATFEHYTLEYHANE